MALDNPDINRNSKANKGLQTFIGRTHASPVDHQLLARFERLTGRKPHRYLRRGIVFSHRDFNLILDKYERGEPIFLKTGRGPSSESLHIGHSIPFEFTQWLQEVLNAPLVIMLTDDMKLLHTPSLPFSAVQQFTSENAKDILAFGFPEPSTFMFSNLSYVGGAFYRNIVALARHIPVRDIKTALGFDDEKNIGMFYCSSTQCAGAFATSYPGILADDPETLDSMACLIACSYDIDGYFSEGRKNAPKLGYASPAFLYSSLLPSLQGPDVKMSASVEGSAMYLTDEPHTIKKKVEENIGDIEVAFQYLRFFMEDDNELERRIGEYKTGKLDRKGVIRLLVDILQTYVANFQKRRAEITDEDLEGFMKRRLLK